MGMQWSKEEDPGLEKDVLRIKSCLENHRSNVHGIKCSVNAQDNSVQILRGKLDELLNYRHERKGEDLKITTELLSNIQDSLNHQVKAVTKSFDILDYCIEEISSHYIPTAESTPAKHEKKTQGSQNRGIWNGPPSSDDISKRGALLKDDDKGIIASLRKENEAISSTNSALQSQLKRAKDEIDKLNHNINRMTHFEEASRRIQNEKDELRKEYAKREYENKTLKEEVQKLKRTADDVYTVRSKLDRSESEKRKLQYTVDQLRRQINGLEEEKRKIEEQKMIVPVQLFYHRKDDLMTLVVNELSSMLRTQMQTKGIQLNIVGCDNTSNIEPDKPILVLCINSSRLGTDATTAIEGVQKSGRTSLLIFHHKNIHALPNQPSDRMLTSPEFKQLGGIFDLAFLTGKGIYPCDMNNTALSFIESFIQRNCPGQQ